MKQAAASGRVRRPFAQELVSLLDHVREFMGTTLARRLVLGLFIAQAILLVFIVKIGVPPDETNHISFIEYYANHSLSPVFTNQQPTYNLGDKTREVDYLYHYGMSLLYRILPLSAEGKYIDIRLCSVGFALLCFVFLAKILKRLGVSAAVTTTALLILTNVPMVLMMSSAINNDAPVWLGMVVGVFLLLRLWERPRVLDLAWLMALAVGGGLIKRTMLPIGLLFGVLGLVVLIRNLHTILEQLQRIDWRLILASLAVLVSIGLFVERVGGNLLYYHTVTPSCEQVHGVDPCTVFWVNVRAQSLAQYTPEASIPLPSFVVSWFSVSLYNVLDIQTQYWQHQVQPATWITPCFAVLFVTGLAYGMYYDWRLRRGGDHHARWRLYVVLIGLYFMAVHLLINYQSYLEIKSFGLALNGRYILPSLIPLVGFACFYWSVLLRRHKQLLTGLAIVVVLTLSLGSGLQLMVRNPQLYLGCTIDYDLPPDCN